MKLIYRISIRLAIALSAVIALWSALFYFSIINQVNSEVDDMLKVYSDDLMMRHLAGRPLPDISQQSNNEYYLQPISLSEAMTQPHIHYSDTMVYLASRREVEPARIVRLIYQTSNGFYYKLTVATPTIEKNNLQLNILIWTIVLFAGLILIILATNIWVYLRSVRPLYRLLAWLDGYRLGEQNEPLINETNILEFRRLNEAVTRNMERSEGLYADQRLFIGNVSHELQTPIAIVRNRLESLMQDETLTEPQLEELARLYERMEYMTRLNRSLLTLSRIDNNQYIDRERIDLGVRLEHILSEYREVYAARGITHELHIASGDLFSPIMSTTLAGILLTNLIKNAYVHTREGGHIVIRLTERSLIVSNTAEEGALDSEHIFDRFYQRGKRSAGSMGLGLALVRSVCRAERLLIRYDYTDSTHVFTLSPQS